MQFRVRQPSDVSERKKTCTFIRTTPSISFNLDASFLPENEI